MELSTTNFGVSSEERFPPNYSLKRNGSFGGAPEEGTEDNGHVTVHAGLVQID